MKINEEKEMTVEEFFNMSDSDGGIYQIETPEGWKDINVLLRKKDKHCFLLRLEGGYEIECANTHLVLTKQKIYPQISSGIQVSPKETQSWKTIEQLDVKNDKIATKDGFLSIIAIETIGIKNCFDFNINSETNSYFSNGIVSHNSGKSLSAKAVAKLYEVPLLRLDFGRMFNSLVGESERAARDAIKLAEALSPVVLWIDEVDKGISGTRSSGSTDGGTTSRVVSTFLTWMQEKTCFDDKTEILTRSGWKKFKKLLPTDEVATRTEDGHFEWNVPHYYINKPHKGEMVKFKSKTTDLLVTPDHRMLVKFNHSNSQRPNEKEIIKPARELVGMKNYAYRVPATSKWVGKKEDFFVLPAVSYEKRKQGSEEIKTINVDEIKIPIKIWMALLGIYIAEGFTTSGNLINKKTNFKCKYYRVSITQTKPDTKKKIEELLKLTPFKWRYENNSFCCNSISLYTYLKKLGKSWEKYIPDDILELDSENLKVMWEWMLKGDGNRTNRERRFNVGGGIDNYGSTVVLEKARKLKSIEKQTTYFTTSPELVADVQELLQKIGKDSSVTGINPSSTPSIVNGREIQGRRICYKIYQRDSKTKAIDGEIVEYDGMVHCVSVKNGIIYVRRHGKTMWCGNCPVFVVATANNHEDLPTEFMRAGRFDEMFFVDLPSTTEREEIFKVLLRRKGRKPEEFDFKKLSGHSQNYSGAEIEKAINNAMFVSYADKERPLTTEDIIIAIGGFKPLYDIRKDAIDAMRDWADGRCVIANTPEANSGINALRAPKKLNIGA